MNSISDQSVKDVRKPSEIIGGFTGWYVAADRYSEDFVRGEFEVYYALAKLLCPRSVLEVGVYCGYSAAAILAGARQSLQSYVGVDAELYRHDSNAHALEMIRQMQSYLGIAVTVEMHKIDTQLDSVAPRLHRRFDWIHVDAAHETEQALRDIRQMWPLAAKVMTVHDVISHTTVQKAVQIVESEGGLKDCSGTIDVVSSHGFRLYLR